MSSAGGGSNYSATGDYSYKGSVSAGQYSSYINSSAEKYGVSAALVKAVGSQESSLGSTGIKNIMQVNGMTNSSPQESIDKGTSMLADYVRKYGNVEYALAAYNMGPGVIDYMKKNGITDARKGMAAFSSYMKQSKGYKVYGDPNYIDNVMRYYKA